MQFVKRDFVHEYHQCPTYTTKELADKPESYFDGYWDGGTSGGETAVLLGMEVYYFWREMDGDTIEVLIEGYEPDVIAYCTLQTGLGDIASSVLIEHVIGTEKLDEILTALKKAMGL